MVDAKFPDGALRWKYWINVSCKDHRHVYGLALSSQSNLFFLYLILHCKRLDKFNPQQHYFWIISIPEHWRSSLLCNLCVSTLWYHFVRISGYIHIAGSSFSSLNGHVSITTFQALWLLGHMPFSMCNVLCAVCCQTSYAATPFVLCVQIPLIGAGVSRAV